MLTNRLPTDLVRLRAVDALDALQILADHVKEDASFEPLSSKSTRRVHVAAGGADWELLVDGPKFFDTRSRIGGGGAIDLVMYVWRLPFKKAVAMLTRAGV